MPVLRCFLCGCLRLIRKLEVHLSISSSKIITNKFMSLAGTSSHGLLSITSNSAVDLLDFNAIKISIADPEKIRSWYFGEVIKP